MLGVDDFGLVLFMPKTMAVLMKFSFMTFHHWGHNQPKGDASKSNIFYFQLKKNEQFGPGGAYGFMSKHAAAISHLLTAYATAHVKEKQALEMKQQREQGSVRDNKYNRQALEMKQQREQGPWETGQNVCAS